MECKQAETDMCCNSLSGVVIVYAQQTQTHSCCIRESALPNRHHAEFVCNVMYFAFNGGNDWVWCLRRTECSCIDKCSFSWRIVFAVNKLNLLEMCTSSCQ